MAIALQIPELADGGYWYVVRVVTDEDGGTGPDLIAPGWCAWYGTVAGQALCAVRTPDPLVGVAQVGVPVSAVLEAAIAEGSISYAKPYGRINGR